MGKKLLLVLGVNILSLYLLFTKLLAGEISIVLGLICALLGGIFTFINVLPIENVLQTERLQILSRGCEFLRVFLFSLTATIIIQLGICIYIFLNWESTTTIDVVFLILAILFAIACESVIFWNGILRVYLTSVQLGIKHRVLGAIFAWVLGANIYYLNKIINICEKEVEFESYKIDTNNNRVESGLCKTKYPILMVHGVFFRDFRYLNYWGRIPQELQKNGATIFYGEQQSAATVESCGIELSERIQKIVQETGCEKVNIIAHSKGGLDSRVAISNFGSAPYVASLTTINTPHNGCIFAEYLFNKCPKRVKDYVAVNYNAALSKFGDKSPDFIGAVSDLTMSSCVARNKVTPNVEGVLYESVASYCNKARHVKFPMNFSHRIVKYFDGRNDGLVSIDSAKWGSSYTLLEPKGKRGISHGDMIDLNRENIVDFDVREFYVELVASLKNRGY